jgi:predicted transcriptional regulator of viral defense system
MSQTRKQHSWTTVGALAAKLASSYQQPALTSYQLAKALFELYRDKTFRGIPLRITKDRPSNAELNRAKEALIRNGLIEAPRGFPPGVFRYMPHSLKNIEEIVCCADQFAFISHLSAMEFHGLTDRLPMTIFITTLPYPEWKASALEFMKADLADNWNSYKESRLPQIMRPKLEKIERKQVHVTTSATSGAYINVRGSVTRVASIGRTFLDMLRKPDLCGGMNHVIDVYTARAGDYLDLVTSEISQHGNKIEHARAGFILENYCHISDPRIDTWTKDVQRGGSRKLDSSAEYMPHFSERWGISINVVR